MDISWDDAQLFLAVTKTGSFSAAARQLHLGQPTVSRRIADLEYRLGWPLFHRGRRGAELTEEAQRLVPAARQMERWAQELERTIAGRERAAEGLVRITAPPGISYDFLVPFTGWMKAQHPGIRLQILASIDFLDLLRGQAELAIRTRPPDQPGLVCLAEWHFPVAPFAHVDYLDQLGEAPALADVDWIGWAPPFEHLAPNPQLRALIPGFKPAFASDNFLIQARACQLGLGAMFHPVAQHPLVDMGPLAQVPVDLPPIDSAIYLVCAHNMEYVSRVRTVAQALIRQLESTRSG